MPVPAVTSNLPEQSERVISSGGKINPNWYRHLKDMGRTAARGGRDWIYPEDFGARGAATQQEATNCTSAFAQAMAAAVEQKKKLVTRGYFNGTRKWYGIQPALEIPEGLVWEFDGDVGIQGLTSTGILLRWRTTPRMSRMGCGHLLVDGGNALTTIAGGYVADHEGMVVAKQWKSNVTGNLEPGSGYGTDILEAVIQGVDFQNFGSGGLETYFLRDPRLLGDVGAKRCGWFGVLHMSPYGVRQRTGKAVDIFPGLPSGGAAYERNAYGFGGSSWSGDRVPFRSEFNDLEAHDVTSWEGFDWHNARECGFVKCRTYNCSQAHVFENHIDGIGMDGLYVEGCEARGYGGSIVRDGVTFYGVVGLVCNATGASGTGSLDTQLVRVDNYTAYNVGEGRPGVNGGAGMVFRGVRNLRVTGASLYAMRQAGISLIAGSDSTDQISFAIIDGAIIDGVTTHNSIQRGIQASSRVLGRARACYVQGIATKAEAFFQSGSGSPALAFNYGTIGDGSSTTAQSDNIAHGAT